MGFLHLLVGPNGSGKTTFYEKVLGPATRLPFVNADVIAKAIAGGAPITEDVSVKAAVAAADRREVFLDAGESFIAESVFSHPSKVEFVRVAVAAGYDVCLHVFLIPEDLAVARVGTRVTNGGHDVPEDRIRSRYERLWPLVVEAIGVVSEATIYDNSSLQHPYVVVARFLLGEPLAAPVAPWPAWTPAVLAETAGQA